MNISDLICCILVLEQTECTLGEIVDNISEEENTAVAIDLLKDCRGHAMRTRKLAMKLGRNNRTLSTRIRQDTWDLSKAILDIFANKEGWDSPLTISKLKDCQYSFKENHENLVRYAYVTSRSPSNSVVAHHHPQCKWRRQDVSGTAAPTTASRASLPAATGRVLERGNEATSQSVSCPDFRIAQ